MRIAACLHKFSPFGGLSKDFLNIMTIYRDRGYDIDVYAMEWYGKIPDNFNINVVSVKAWTNHKKIKKFIARISLELKKNNYDLVIGFNKMPGLDIYYSADSCYMDRVKNQESSLIHRLGRRFRFYTGCEKSVFGLERMTISLIISDIQCDIFKKIYATPDRRLFLLPPGISPDRKRPNNWQQTRLKCRDELGIYDEFLLLMVGTAFKTKGVDRSITALAALPNIIQKKTKLIIAGEGYPKSYLRLVKQYSLEKNVIFLGGRKDISKLLLSADLLLHPSRRENAGIVILEAIVAGLPAISSGESGYSEHVAISDSGLVIPIPFSQVVFNKDVYVMLCRNELRNWSNKGLYYAESENLYSMPEKAANIIDQVFFLN